jgi:hypothetical protein
MLHYDARPIIYATDKQSFVIYASPPISRLLPGHYAALLLRYRISTRFSRKYHVSFQPSFTIDISIC